ncbi:uncharacterized protein LOC110705610 [Chenopodium quinoa]|uniref:uncharacterized protein LOC110705610 n=1 Tax=Chenopodium quinoa TaxID=63459 RepID=UPI000B77A92B|nr:uncharacterized protein LOC110705610 [Chenopodium quinoa]
MENNDNDLLTTASQLPRLVPLQKKFYVPQCPSMYRNGMLHCVLRGVDDVSQINLDLEGNLMGEDNIHLRMACFNLSTEEWEDEDLGFPNTDPDDDTILRVYLSFLNGCFCPSLLTLNFIDVWIKKESWTKLCRVSRHNKELVSLQCPLIAYTSTRSEALLFHYAKHPNLVWYDLKYEKLEQYEGRINSGYIGYVNLCVGTLVSIPEGQRAPKANYVEEGKLNKPKDNNLPALPKKLEKKFKGKKILYYSWNRTS